MSGVGVKQCYATVRAGVWVAEAVVCSAGLSWEWSIRFPFHSKFFISKAIFCQEKNLSVGQRLSSERQCPCSIFLSFRETSS